MLVLISGPVEHLKMQDHSMILFFSNLRSYITLKQSTIQGEYFFSFTAISTNKKRIKLNNNNNVTVVLLYVYCPISTRRYS